MSELMSLDLPCPGGVDHVSVRISHQAINLLVGRAEPSFTFDRAGRLIGAFAAARHYRRGLDNRVLEKRRGALGQRERRWLSPGEVRELLDRVYGLARRVAAETEDPRLAVLSAWDCQSLAADADRFAEVYRPVSILPPDQYMALVLQATEGCSHNRCTFCDFYRDRPFRIKGPEAFRQHLAGVRDYFGAGLSLRKSLFLADANALVAPMKLVRDWFAIVEQAGLLPGAAIFSFIDAFNVDRKSAEEWGELAKRGLRRVYIGMESGDSGLVSYLGKPGTVQQMIDAVSHLKAAGVAVSVIVMTGIGGDRFAGAHVAGTVQALNAMPLGTGDIIYFSPFVESCGSEYSHRARRDGLRSLTASEMLDQERQIRRALAARAAPPTLSHYDIRESVY